MKDFDMQEALDVYLGSEGTGGFDPIWPDRRLRARYGADAEQVKARVEEFLRPIWKGVYEFRFEPDIHVRGAALAQQLHPELDPIICRAIGNMISFDWK